MPDPSWMAQQQAQQAAQQAQQIHQNHVRIHREMHDMARHTGAPHITHRPTSYGGGGGGGGGSLRGFLTLVVIVAVVVYVARDPELRAEVMTFARNLWAQIQSS
ncbi:MULTISPECIES: hypothetical protein [Streptomyces]|uniref:Uncharacterized protein n=1 Tax=Streptomyces dengpaensis TaxID=2049881 RepID=A0ABN5HXM3_9ACTN|nr:MULTISPECIES: hypothetical protein [Streptomyces]AVH55833.1 hypothetical protein C4B68_08670 [Streptomyces dengpaensis]PIB12088.1 hypothetical protein B1C81_02605 [Streptomyces sp. HG99]